MVGIPPTWRFSPIQNPVNVKFGEGLAVEFAKESSSYLTLGQALSMNKVVISFWFRIPKESADKVSAATPGFFWEYRVFQGVIPLITWGSQMTTPVTEAKLVDTGAIDESAGSIIIYDISGSHTAPLQPSGIGVYVEAYPEFPPTLDVLIQTNVHASGSHLAEIETGWSGEFVGINVAPGPQYGKPIYRDVVYTMTDISYTVTEEPEYLGNSDSSTGSSGAGYPKVKVDEWHHVLISWELVSHSNTVGASKMWCAVDDKNLTGYDLPAMCDPGVGMGPNDHKTWNTFRGYPDPAASISVTFKDSNDPFNDDVPSNPFRTPGPPTANRASDDSGGVVSIAPIATVELAELQIFTGITLDTADEVKRRAFADYERDEKGNIIKDKDGKATLKPVNPKKAEKLLGKKPEILLHGSSKWINGKNTGTIGVNYSADPPEEKLEGQFKPTGEIKKYKPDPSLQKVPGT